jgi:hypothetical protein
VGPEKRPNFVGFTGDIATAPIVSPDISAQPGRFATARISAAGGEERTVIGAVFTPEGDIEAGDFNITRREDESGGSDVAAAPLPRGGFIVAWTERKVPHVGDTTGDNVKAMLCSTLGPLQPSPIQVSSATSGDQRFPDVAVSVDELGETRIALAWLDDSVSGAASANRAIQARVLPGATQRP